MKCIICGKEIKGYGNNPDPIKNEKGELFDVEAKCCDECDNVYVIPYRLAQITQNKQKLANIQNEVDKVRGFGQKKALIAIIERPDGSTYEQEIENVDNDIDKSMKKAQSKLGNPVAWYTDSDGRRQKYIKKNAYVVVDAFFRG